MIEPVAGSRLGQYRLVAPIGAGGMGRVWAALDEAAPSLRLVAVKVALGEEGAGRQYWTALSDEASVAARINHPNVCSTYGLGMEGDVHFLVMEWSDGASLRDLLDALPSHRLPTDVAARIAASVAAGLHAAHKLADDAGHELGVVHRDVSPQNVLISTRGHVLLADFGVAKARGQLRRPTETGELKGKLSYMAPEQISSKDVDRRADVFALGCVLYEAALGVRAFHGADALSTMYQILEEPVVAPRSVDPTFPEALEAILMKAMAKDLRERYQTAEELHDALLEFLGTDTADGNDRSVSAALESALGGMLSARNRSLRGLAEQLRRGEPITPVEVVASRPSSTTPGGLAMRTAAGAKSRRYVAWAAIGSVVAVAAVAAVLLIREKEVTPAVSTVAAPVTELAPSAAALPSAEPAVSAETSPSPEPLEPTAEPSAETTSARGPRTAPRPGGKPVSGTAPAASPSTPPTGARPTPASDLPRGKPVRPPRSLDQSNPFADQ